VDKELPPTYYSPQQPANVYRENFSKNFFVGGWDPWPISLRDYGSRTENV
jgi:hypothetical protein